MRISDWSSDVCSSDLSGGRGAAVTADPLTIPLAAPARGAYHRTTAMRGECAPRMRLYITARTGRAPITDVSSGFPSTASSTARYPSAHPLRSEEHTSELQSLMRISYAVSCLKTKNPTYRSLKDQH